MQWVEKENALLLQESQEGSQFHKDILDYMFIGLEASTKREGFVVVEVQSVLDSEIKKGCGL